VLNQLLFLVAKRFVSGQTIQEAIPVVRHLNSLGILATLDVLGENVSDRRAAEVAVASYL
jgi:proline dehydrogenase